MVRIKCPGCAEVQDFNDSLRGQVVECAGCSRFLEVPQAEDRPAEKKQERRKKKGRRKRPADSDRGLLRYYLGVIDPFGWVLVGLAGLWLGSLVLAVMAPGVSRLLLLVGSGLFLFGNVWIGFVAYKDSQVFGMLCFCTCLFTYVYVFMNPDETWRPAVLTGLGFLFTLSGALASHMSAMPAPAA